MYKTICFPNLPASSATSRQFQKSKRIKLFSESLNFDWKIVLLVSANTILLFGYLFGINNSAAKGYEIKSIQNRLTTLSEENRKLNLKFSEQSAVALMQAQADNTQFVPVGQVVYLQKTQLSQK